MFQAQEKNLVNVSVKKNQQVKINALQLITAEVYQKQDGTVIG